MPTARFNAMERLHKPATNAFGTMEHIYTLHDIDEITRKIANDEWMALGSTIAEAMLETILDVSGDVLKRMRKDERVKITERIGEEISRAVEVCLFVPLLIVCFLLYYSSSFFSFHVNSHFQNACITFPRLSFHFCL